MGAARHFGADPIPVKSSFDAEVDLRGTRALDCADEVERAIDLALQRNVDVVVLRHGHGGGALRKLVREHLRTLPYVRKHRGGLVQEGGEAVTVVWIEV